jgi:hypothetical protein
VQAIWPQQSKLLVQLWVDSRQQVALVGDARHEAPSQHSEAAPQGCCSTRHMGPVARHTASMQLRPAPHWAPGQQRCPDSPQGLPVSVGTTTPVSSGGVTPVSSVGATPVSSVGATPVSSVGATPVSSVGATPVSSVGVTLPVSCVSPPSDSPPPPPVPPRALHADRASKATSQPYAQTGARLFPCTEWSIAGRAVARPPARRT